MGHPKEDTKAPLKDASRTIVCDARLLGDAPLRSPYPS